MIRRRAVVVLLCAAIHILAAACGAEPTDTPSRQESDEPDPTKPSRKPPSTSAGTGPRATTTVTPRTTQTADPVLELPAGDDVSVTRIIDGDTLVVTSGERVRLIGIDTPEVNQDECFADQATAHLASLVPPGTAVRLVNDVDRHDRYGRTLAYLYRRDDGLHVNLAMARDGFAQQLTIPPNVAHADDFADAIAEARSAERGLWGAGCGHSSSEPTETAGPGPPLSPSGSCDPSYPTLCIPPGAPDLDCNDVTERYFPVQPPDPHRLDGNHDGIGCETP